MLRYKEIKYQLENMIASMLPGDALPSREALCMQMDTTYATLHKAIVELAGEGKLYTRAGSGTYVAGDSEAQTEIHSIAVLLPDASQQSYQSLLSGIDDFLRRKNVNMILSMTEGDIEKQNRHLTRLIESQISGMIMVPALCMDIARGYILYTRIMQHKLPSVFCFRGIDGLNETPAVLYNNFYGGYLATCHLIKMGYKRIAYIAQHMQRTSLDRYQGYVAALIENNLEIKRNAIVLPPALTEMPPGYQEMKRIIESDYPVDAVVCQADILVPGVYQAIQECGKRVSDDIGVISFDNDFLCLTQNPQVTSLGGKDFEIGQKAAETLWEMINGKAQDVPFFLMQPQIMVRSSCLGKKDKA